MRSLLILALALLVVCPANAGSSGNIFKVLPLLVDREGRTATSPSLFDRDAYQASLRGHMDQVSAIRYDVEWRAKKSAATNHILKLELRGVATDGKPVMKIFETAVAPGGWRKWTSFTLQSDELKKLGSVVAWRATLQEGTTVVGEQKSFLW